MLVCAKKKTPLTRTANPSIAGGSHKNKPISAIYVSVQITQYLFVAFSVTCTDALAAAGKRGCAFACTCGVLALVWDKYQHQQYDNSHILLRPGWEFLLAPQ